MKTQDFASLFLIVVGMSDFHLHSQTVPSPAVLFDLDGTLIDSSKGILQSLEYAFRQSSILPPVPLTSDIIGPPLPELIKGIAGTADPEILQAITNDFTDYYDRIGCFEESTYPGIEDLLLHLNSVGVHLHVTTNKRLRPTLQILSHLRLEHYFKSIYSPDTLHPKASNKTQLLAAQLLNEKLCHDQSIYVGDRLEDWSAAKSNSIRFGWACWGFSPNAIMFEDNSLIFKAPEELLNVYDL